ncbi:hypothetical protein BN946_scf184985.g99 [Trametes cinnabarina]|uniref:Uncharacterized protein n=1 Tax=Pycnoporus cinnabarinus TaxID=5643 RepID=A0A060SKA9_PYCCI|nr:hypothetical protein BN946_scf184985.g99 [Trametes cinnabarina]
MSVLLTPCPGDLASVESISEQFCAQAATSTFLSFPTPPPTTTFSDPFSSSTAASASGNSSSATAPSSSSTSFAAPTGQGNGATALGTITGVTGFFGLAIALASVVLA